MREASLTRHAPALRQFAAAGATAAAQARRYAAKVGGGADEAAHQGVDQSHAQTQQSARQVAFQDALPTAAQAGVAVTSAGFEESQVVRELQFDQRVIRSLARTAG